MEGKAQGREMTILTTQASKQFLRKLNLAHKNTDTPVLGSSEQEVLE